MSLKLIMRLIIIIDFRILFGYSQTMGRRVRSYSFHRLAAKVAAAPLFLIVCTGILLQVKAGCSWIQPSAKKGSIVLSAATPPSIDLKNIFKVSLEVSG